MIIFQFVYLGLLVESFAGLDATEWSAISTVIIAIATIAYVIISKLQLDSFKETFLLEHRPYITFNVVQNSQQTNAINQGPHAGKRSIHFSMKNIGSAPAKNISIIFIIKDSMTGNEIYKVAEEKIPIALYINDSTSILRYFPQLPPDFANPFVLSAIVNYRGSSKSRYNYTAWLEYSGATHNQFELKKVDFT